MKLVQDDTWTGIKNLKNNITMMMMGSASELPPEPAEKTQFIEDMSESQVNQAVSVLLPNMGITCQCIITLYGHHVSVYQVLCYFILLFLPHFLLARI